MTSVKHCGKPSMLKDSSVEGLEGVKWCSVMHEMKERAPDVLDFIATVATPDLRRMWMNRSLQSV